MKSLLTTARLLTITGTGGSGKTQVALHVIADLLQAYEQHIWRVDLSTLTDPAAVPHAVALVLGIPLPSDGTLVEGVLDFLRVPEKALLILDHCEHMVSSCASLVEQILYVCQGMQMLVISREPLGIAGEAVWQIPLLSFPDAQSASFPEELTHYEAIQLFIEQATVTRPSLRLSRKNLELVTQICRRLEGHPLAIKLAAARVKVLTLEQILVRLDDCRSLLRGGCRLCLPRHQSMWTTIDHSYTLLTEKEQQLFRRLAAFPDSFSLEAIEKIGAGGDIEVWEILDLLLLLVNKSLVIVEEQKEEVCYRLPEPIRQYSRQKLRESGEKIAINERYHSWQTGKQYTYIEVVEHSVALRIFALGPVQVYRGDYALASTDWRYAKARELLFYLLCHRAKTKEQIGLALWPDASSTLLRSTFHTTLHYLRKALGVAEWIAFKDGYYTFNRLPDFWFDVEVFESHLLQAWQCRADEPDRAIQSLQEAVRHYRGGFLEDLLEGDWYLPRQRELHQRFLDALFSLGHLLFAEKQYARASEVYRQIIAHDSYMEVAHRELIRCYARQGERGLALRHYQTVESIMHDEFDALPAAETIALYERLRQGGEI